MEEVQNSVDPNQWTMEEVQNSVDPDQVAPVMGHVDQGPHFLAFLNC